LVCGIAVGEEYRNSGGGGASRWGHRWIEWPTENGYHQIDFYPLEKPDGPLDPVPGFYRSEENVPHLPGFFYYDTCFHTCEKDCDAVKTCLKDFVLQAKLKGKDYNFCTNNCYGFVHNALATCGLSTSCESNGSPFLGITGKE
jgi:hypothetical protein